VPDSPDGHWIAYASDESGTFEVYVRPFPNTQAGRWQISNGGGQEPRWSADGRQIYYLDAETRMMAAQVSTRVSFSVNGIQTLFTVPADVIVDQFHQTYEVSPDDRTFYFLSSRSRRQGVRIVWVDNWFSDVRARAGR
jgi:Tol biopolymer transport system component